jgi:hypothetical protein
MNEIQALRWFASVVIAGASLSMVVAWTILYFLRKKIRHNREVRHYNTQPPPTPQEENHLVGAARG